MLIPRLSSLRTGCITATVALATVLIAGCGGSSSTSSSAPASTTSSSSAPASTPAAAAPTGGTAQTVKLSAVPNKLAFNTTALTAKAGKVTLIMSNPASFKHGVAIEGNGVDKDGKIVGTGGTSTVTVTLKPGKYTFYCPVPSHRQGGMHGTLTVS